MNDLIFNEALHEYRHKGVVIPSVTQSIDILYAGMFDKIPRAVLEYKTKLGRAVHFACELYDQGELDESSLDDAVRGYFEGWKKFTSEYKCQWTAIEKMVFHPVHQYAGKLDRRGFVNGEPCLIDIKAVAVVSKATGVQLAGYEEADKFDLTFEEKLQKPKRVAVQLKPNGTYERHVFDSPNDWPTFIACLTVKRFIK